MTVPHQECIRAALRNGTVDPREKTLALRDALCTIKNMDDTEVQTQARQVAREALSGGDAA